MLGYPLRKTVKFWELSQNKDYKALITEPDSEEIVQHTQGKIGSAPFRGILLFLLAFLAMALIGVWIGAHWFGETNSLRAEQIYRCYRKRSVLCSPNY